MGIRDYGWGAQVKMTEYTSDQICATNIRTVVEF